MREQVYRSIYRQRQDKQRQDKLSRRVKKFDRGEYFSQAVLDSIY